MSHYFDLDKDLKSVEFFVDFDIFNHHFKLISDLGVFSKDELDIGTETLIKSSINEGVFGDVLDLGCGIGTVGIVLQTLLKKLNIDMVDINERALNLAKKNIDNLKLDNCHVFFSNAYQQINRHYDFILTNPPIRAGKDVVNTFILESYNHLKENGVLLVVMRKSHGAPSAKKRLEEKFNNCEIITRNKGFYILKCVKK
ncbi:MAG: methyltransferase [Bacilli bacterium]|nr:methyltransferase [Bacilli bacterium]